MVYRTVYRTVQWYSSKYEGFTRALASTVIWEIFVLIATHVNMFVLKKFVVYNTLTRFQLCNTCGENILCLIFVVFDDSEIFITTKLSQITVYTCNVRFTQNLKNPICTWKHFLKAGTFGEFGKLNNIHLIFTLQNHSLVNVL